MHRRFHRLLVLAAVSLIVLGCTAPSTPSQPPSAAKTATTTLTVFAAASLTNAFKELGKTFASTHPGTEVVFNFAGSNQLATQIGEGAPADIFASANATQMNLVIATGRILSGTQQTFVRNRLVVVTPADNPAGLTGLQDLATPGVKIVFAAKEVPVGQYALDFLAKAEADGSLGIGFQAAVIANVVSYEENVRTVLAKVALGEGDAGIVYTSDVAANGTERVGHIEIPDSLNTIASYPIVVMHDSPQLELAQQFVRFVLGADGQQILETYGFMPHDR